MIRAGRSENLTHRSLAPIVDAGDAIQFTAPNRMQGTALFGDVEAGDTLQVATGSGLNDGTYTVAVAGSNSAVVNETIATESAAAAGAVSISIEGTRKTGSGRVRFVYIEGDLSATTHWLLRDGTTSAAPIILELKTSAGGTFAEEFPVQFRDGLFVDYVSGLGRVSLLFS